MANLVSLDYVKRYLGLPAAPGASDPVLTDLIAAYSAAVESYCQRSFASATYTESYSGNNKSRLLLKNYPVTAVASLAIGGQPQQPVPTPGDSLTPGFRIVDVSRRDQRLLLLNGSVFGRGEYNVAVTYTAGYPVVNGVVQVPPDLAQAVAELIGLRFKSREWIGYVSKTLAGETVTFMTQALSPAVQSALGNYLDVTLL